MTRANGRLALGTAQLGMAYGVANRRGRLSARDVEAILDAAIALGVRCFDTAPVYGDAEQAIGEWRKRRAPSQEIEISTKLPRLPTEIDVWRFVRDAIERSRRRLNVEVIDHYLVHSPDDLSPALVEALARAQHAGWVQHIGASVYEPVEAERAFAFSELDAIQFPFNLFDRRFAELAKTPVTFARSVLLQGLFTLAPSALPPELEHAKPWLDRLHAFCREHDVAPAALALSYAASQSSADYLVLGVESPEQLKSANDLLARPLPRDVIQAIETRFADVPESVLDPRRWSKSTQ